MPNKTSKKDVKEQTPLLPKDTKLKHHKHKPGSHKKCPDCQKDAGLAAAEAAKATNQTVPTIVCEDGLQSDSKAHSSQNLFATKARAVKNANRFKTSEVNSGHGSGQEQQPNSLPENFQHIWDDFQKVGQSAKDQVTKNLNLLKEYEREAAENIQNAFGTADSKQKPGLARTAKRVKNAHLFVGQNNQDQEHQRSEEYGDDVVDYLEGEDRRHRDRNKKIFVFSFIFAVIVLSGMVTVISLAGDAKRDKSS
ncbi:hypothetical protein HYALB_00001224 [Hymenoscyphus albidus]|uniref:Transmembrane protein n=1 Tax=Hymenoscyphus albidus TaxID=595503 RepID=A0A9N9LH77_9HELO|nr:hypothetical protein HYALB_00001224 [Hymenoscyphus albidus]